jgi:hypothetical protein
MNLGVRQIRTAGKGSGNMELTLPANLRDLVSPVGSAGLALAAAGLVVSVAFGPPPASNPAGASELLRLLPYLTSFLAVAAGGLCLFARPARGEDTPDPAEALLPGLQRIINDFNFLLAETRNSHTAFQATFEDATQETAANGKRLARLVATATEADTRLAAGVVQAEQALRKSAAVVSQAADTTQRVERAIPDLIDMVRREIEEQSQAVASALETAAARLVAEADTPVRAFHAVVTDAADKISALADTALSARLDVAGLHNGSREIAAAGAVIVTRFDEAVGHVDAVLQSLPKVTGGLSQVADQAVQAVARAAGALAVDSEALRSAGQGIAERLDGAERAITAAGTGMVSRTVEAAAHIEAALTHLPSAAADITAAAGQAARTLTEAAAALHAKAAAMEEAGRAAVQAADALRSAGQDIAVTGAARVADAGQAVTQIHTAPGPRPDLTAGINEAARQATHTLTEAAAFLSTDSDVLNAFGRETLRVIEAHRATSRI